MRQLAITLLLAFAVAGHASAADTANPATDPESSIQAARSAIGSQHWAEADRLLRSVADAEQSPTPQRLSALNLLAIVQARQGNYLAARPFLERALALDESFDLAWETLGDVQIGLAAQAYAKAERTRASPRLGGKLATVRSLFTLPENEVMAVIERWRSAWQARDATTYLAAYAAAFKAPDDMTVQNWRALRTRRLGAARDVKVTLDNLRLSFAPHGNTVSATFVEHLVADDYRRDAQKELELERTREGWRIVRETLTPSTPSRQR